MSGADLAAAGPDPDERMTAALRLPPPPSAPVADRAVLTALRDAPVVAAGRIPESSNIVLLLELDAPDPDGGPLRAVYKPVRGERPLWDFPYGTLHFREVATYELDVALGLGLVPPTVLREGPAGPGSLQRYVAPAGRELEPAEESRAMAALPAVALLDALANNADRKSAHLLAGAGGRLWAIDHGLTFLPYPRQRTVLIGLGGGVLPARPVRRLRSLAGDPERRAALDNRLGALLTTIETEATAARIDELAADPVLPVLDDWDGRPFEWW